MNNEHYKTLQKDSVYKTAIGFINRCGEVGIPITAIDVNDWHCNFSPKVYVHNKANAFKMRGYKRMNEQNIERALNWYKSTTAKQHIYAE